MCGNLKHPTRPYSGWPNTSAPIRSFLPTHVRTASPLLVASPLPLRQGPPPLRQTWSPASPCAAASTPARSMEGSAMAHSSWPWRTYWRAHCSAAPEQPIRASFLAALFSARSRPARPPALRATTGGPPLPLCATVGGASSLSRPTRRRALPHPPRSVCFCRRWGGQSALLLPGLLYVEARRED